MLCVIQFSIMLSAVPHNVRLAPIDVSKESFDEYKNNRSYWTLPSFKKKLRSSESRETQHKPVVRCHITEELNLF